MRMTTVLLMFVAVCMFAGCKDQASQPATQQNTINSTVVQPSPQKSTDDFGWNSEESKRILGTDKLKHARSNETHL